MTLLAIVLLSLAGLSLAFASLDDVERDVRSHVVSAGVVGRDMEAREIPSSRIPTWSHVSGPFLVTGHYAVPRGLHASHVGIRYLVLPWGRYALSYRVLHTV